MRNRLQSKKYISVPQQIASNILNILRNADKTINSKELSQRLGYSQNYIKQIASEMVKEKAIKSSQKGYFL